MVSSDEGKRLFDAISIARGDVRTNYPKFFELLGSQDKVAINSFLRGRLAPVLAEYKKAVGELAKHQDSKMDRNVSLIQKMAADALGMVSMVLVVALLVGLILTLWLSANFARRIREASSLAERVAAGNLRDDGRKIDSNDELGMLTKTLISMRSELACVILQVTKSAVDVSNMANQLSTAANQVAISVQSQSSSTAAAVEELTVSIEHVSSNAHLAAHKAEIAGDLSNKGGDQVSATAKSIEAASEDVKHAAQDVFYLQARSRASEI